MLLSSLFSSSSLPHSPSEQIALDDASRLECPSFFFPLSFSSCILSSSAHLCIYLFREEKRQGRGRRRRGVNEKKIQAKVKREDEGETKTNKRIRGVKIVLRGYKLSFCQYPFLLAERGLVAVSSWCPASSGTAKLYKVDACCSCTDRKIFNSSNLDY